MKEVFGLKDKESAKKWIYDNSTEFATGSYRKFQFVIGNNFYAQEGKLVVQTTQTDKMPKDFAVQIGALKNPKDAAQDLKSAAPIVIKEKQSDANPASPVVPALPTTKSQTSKDLKADLFEGDTAKLTVAAESKLKDVAAKIKIDEASIIEVSITGQGDAVELPGERAKAVKSLLEQSGISASILQTYQSPGSELKVNLTINFGNSVRSSRSAEELARAAKDLTDAINQILP